MYLEREHNSWKHTGHLKVVCKHRARKTWKSNTAAITPFQMNMYEVRSPR